MSLDMQWGGLHTVISGGQTGADQGGLLAAWRANVKTGGIAPADYKTSVGNCPLLEVLGLSAAGNFATRTKANVVNSDITVIIANDLFSVGSVLTRREARNSNKPFLDIEISTIIKELNAGASESSDVIVNSCFEQGAALAAFVKKHQAQVLNVAGNRELDMKRLQMTFVSSWIVGAALNLLVEDGKLICKS